MNEQFKKDIARNLKLVEENKPLDVPLVVLDGEFKKEYFKGIKKVRGLNCEANSSSRYGLKGVCSKAHWCPHGCGKKVVYSCHSCHQWVCEKCHAIFTAEEVKNFNK